jgi:hypothetical protein
MNLAPFYVDGKKQDPFFYYILLLHRNSPLYRPFFFPEA